MLYLVLLSLARRFDYADQANDGWQFTEFCPSQLEALGGLVSSLTARLVWLFSHWITLWY